VISPPTLLSPGQPQSHALSALNRAAANSGIEGSQAKKSPARPADSPELPKKDPDPQVSHPRIMTLRESICRLWNLSQEEFAALFPGMTPSYMFNLYRIAEKCFKERALSLLERARTERRKLSKGTEWKEVCFSQELAVQDTEFVMKELALGREILVRFSTPVNLSLAFPPSLLLRSWTHAYLVYSVSGAWWACGSRVIVGKAKWTAARSTCRYVQLVQAGRGRGIHRHRGLSGPICVAGSIAIAEADDESTRRWRRRELQTAVLTVPGVPAVPAMSTRTPMEQGLALFRLERRCKRV